MGPSTKRRLKLKSSALILIACAAADSPSANGDDETDAQGRREYLVHNGILHAAMRVRQYIDKHGLLEAAFRKYPTYKLVITGHSLGAGVTALLGWSYAATAHRQAASRGAEANQSEPESALHVAMSQLVCYAFAPPCGLLSRSASTHLRRFVCSVYLGDDIVPRLSVATMNTLKSELLVVLRECTKPKYQVLASGCWQLCCRGAAVRALEVDAERIDDSGASQHDYNTMRTAPNESDRSDRPATGKSPLLATHGGDLQEARKPDAARQHLKLAHFPRMYAPGIIVQISAEYVTAADEHDRDRDRDGDRNPLAYRLHVASCDDLQRIVVSSSMIAHHLPIPLLSALGRLSRLVDQAGALTADSTQM